MKVVSKVSQTRKSNMSSIPNTFAFAFIRNWLSDKKHEKQRAKYFIGNFSQDEIGLVMKELKWLARNFKGLDIMSIEDKNGNITQIIL